MPSVSIVEAQAPIKGMHIEARSGDPSAFAGASILASLSNLLPPPSKTGEDAQQNTEISSLPSGCGASEDHIPEVEMKDTTSNNESAGASSREKTVGPSSNDANGNPDLDSLELDGCMDVEVGKIPGSTYELRPLLRLLAGSASEFDLSGSISKILEEQRDIRELLKDISSPTILMSTRRQSYKDGLQQGILNPDDIEVSFESFPYYLRCIFFFQLLIIKLYVMFSSLHMIFNY